MLRSLWALGVLVASTSILGAAAAIASLVHPGGYATMRAARLWSRSVLGAAGIRVAYHGLEHAQGLHGLGQVGLEAGGVGAGGVLGRGVRGQG